MLSSKTLKEIVTEARPIIERQLDDAERIAAFREVVSGQGGDWGALKALIKAQIQDERDETGEGKRVKKILDKAEYATGYADMLGWSKMNEKNFSSDDDADPRLIKTVVDGMQTEIGRKALITSLDIMIENEEQNSVGDLHADTPPLATRGAEESVVSNYEMDRATEGSFETGSEAAEKGREAIPAGPEGADLIHAGAGESPAAENEAVAPVATALPSAERVTPHRSGSAAANTGDEHVDDTAPANPHQAGTLVGNHVPAINERCQNVGKCPFSHHPNKIACSPCQKAWESRKVAVPA